MSWVHDMIGKPTRGEIELRAATVKAQGHAEDLEEMLLKPDPEEFTNPRRHVEICFDRQKAAHAWRKAMVLQLRLNGAENRRYSRGIIVLIVAVGSHELFKDGSGESVLAFLKFLGGLL